MPTSGAAGVEPELHDVASADVNTALASPGPRRLTRTARLLLGAPADRSQGRSRYAKTRVRASQTITPVSSFRPAANVGVRRGRSRSCGTEPFCEPAKDAQDFDRDRKDDRRVPFRRDLGHGLQCSQLHCAGVFDHRLRSLGELLGCLELSVGGDDLRAPFRSASAWRAIARCICSGSPTSRTSTRSTCTPHASVCCRVRF